MFEECGFISSDIGPICFGIISRSEGDVCLVTLKERPY